jgi:hypothetical protein
MKSEKHITGLKLIREKLKRGEMEKPKIKEEIIEVKTIELEKKNEEVMKPEIEEKIKDNIKKLLKYEEEIKIPKVILFKLGFFRF